MVRPKRATMTQKLYERIARRENLEANTVHLVHYVVGSLAEAYVPPPSLAKAKGSSYTAKDVCAAVLAYLRARNPENPIETLSPGLLPNRNWAPKIPSMKHANAPT